MKKLFLIGLLALTINNFNDISEQATEPAKEYPQTFIISEIDREADLIYLETFSGMVYTWEGCEDWEVNDLAAAIMNDNGTPDNITDDTIEMLRYSGYLD